MDYARCSTLLAALLAAGCGSKSDDGTGSGGDSGGDASSGTADDDGSGSDGDGSSSASGSGSSATTASGTGSGGDSGTTGGDPSGCPAGQIWAEPPCNPEGAEVTYDMPGCLPTCSSADDSCDDTGSECIEIWIEVLCPCPPWQDGCCEACGTGEPTWLCVPSGGGGSNSTSG